MCLLCDGRRRRNESKNHYKGLLRCLSDAHNLTEKCTSRLGSKASGTEQETFSISILAFDWINSSCFPFNSLFYWLYFVFIWAFRLLDILRRSVAHRHIESNSIHCLLATNRTVRIFIWINSMNMIGRSTRSTSVTKFLCFFSMFCIESKFIICFAIWIGFSSGCLLKTNEKKRIPAWQRIWAFPGRSALCKYLHWMIRWPPSIVEKCPIDRHSVQKFKAFASVVSAFDVCHITNSLWVGLCVAFFQF